MRLQHDSLVLELAPDVGGSIAAFYTEHPGGRRDWLRPATPDALARREPLGMGSFPLVPWCNRIRDGRSSFGARPLALAPNFQDSPHTIHGIGWQRPWGVQSRADDRATLVCQHQPGGPHDWPYAFDAWQQFVLDGEGLQVEMGLINRDTEPMPAGIGHHPYFPHRPGTRLTTQVEAMWASDAELLPTRLERPPFLQRLAQGIVLQEIELDNNFTGWSHEARVDWPDDGTALVMRADPPLDYFVLYSPRGADHFVMEPVSNCTDWMNLAARGVGQAGGTLLAPGDTLRVRFSLRPTS